MKHERSLLEQTRRVDNEKANKIKIVTELPATGTESDFIHKGQPPMRPDDDPEGYYVRLNGEWRYLGSGTDEGDGDEASAAPARPPYSTEIITYSTTLETS